LGGEGVSRLIDRLASTKNLGIFVGAGVSVEAGLPSWAKLVRELLEEIAPELEPFRSAKASGTRDPEELAYLHREFAKKTIASAGLPGAASVAKQHLGSQYAATVRRILYASVEAPSPGPTATAVARLMLRTEPLGQIPVLTTNFDLLVELALKEQLSAEARDPAIVRTVAPGDEPEEDMIDVVHMHGVLPHPASGIRATEIVFSEDEFLTHHAQVDKARAILGERPHLFLGTSLTDTNVLKHLYRDAEEGKSPGHAAVAVSQQAAGDVEPEAAKVVVDSLQSSGAMRLKSARVEVVFVDTYSEASQFVTELILARAAGEGTQYREASWSWRRRAYLLEQGAMESGLLPAIGGREGFKKLQKPLRKVLSDATVEITRGFDAEPALQAEGEQLALHLWVHAPLARLLWMVAQSDRRIYNPATLQVGESTLPTNLLVVEALCNGTVVEARGKGLRSGRWGSMIAVPFGSRTVKVGGEPASVQAGVLVLASTNAADAGLVRLQTRPKDRVELVAAISRLGTGIIDSLLAAAPKRQAGSPDLELLDDEGFPQRGTRALEDGLQRIGPETHVGGAPAEGLTLGKWRKVVPKKLTDQLR